MLLPASRAVGQTTPQNKYHVLTNLSQAGLVVHSFDYDAAKALVPSPPVECETAKSVWRCLREKIGAESYPKNSATASDEAMRRSMDRTIDAIKGGASVASGALEVGATTAKAEGHAGPCQVLRSDRLNSFMIFNQSYQDVFERINVFRPIETDNCEGCEDSALASFHAKCGNILYIFVILRCDFEANFD